MRIVINTLAHNSFSGGITYFRNILPHLADDGNEYLILVPEGRNLLTEIDEDNLEFIRVSNFSNNLLFRTAYEQLILPMKIHSWDADLLFSPGDVTSLLAPCDILLEIQNPNPYFDIDRTFREELKFTAQKHLTWLSAQRAKRVFFVSDYSKKNTNEFLGLPDQKVSTIHHGVSTSRFTPDIDEKQSLPGELDTEESYMLCVSTLYRHKNIEVLIRGYSELPDEVQREYALLLAGRMPSSSYTEELRILVQNRNIEDRVHFLGEVDDETLPLLYTNSSLYVLPSRLETFGLTVLEAMASGTPVVAAQSTCLPEIVSDAGLMFDPDSPTDLEETLRQGLFDESVRKSLIEAGYKRVEHFSWSNAAENLQDIFNEI